ncbi:hypothetical protein ACP70R_010308 [Stipagrostis hirtigluma subsp. patula]
MGWKRTRSFGGGGGRRDDDEEMRERLIPPGCGEDAVAAAACVPRGYVAVLVGGEDGDMEPPERVVVAVRALAQPCVRALLQMAEREFGYDQKGVLRIPCAADEFRRAVAADGTSAGGRSPVRDMVTTCFRP